MFCITGCTSPVVQEGGLANPPLSEKGVVYLFAGLTPTGDDMARSGMFSLTQYIRAAGVRADVYNPVNWKEAADQFPGAASRTSRKRPSPLPAILWAAMPPQFADRLQTAGVPVTSSASRLRGLQADAGALPQRAGRSTCTARTGLFSLAPEIRVCGPQKILHRKAGNRGLVKTAAHKNGRHDHLGVSKEPRCA